MTTQPISPLRQRMIEDMNARKRGRHCQRSHLHSCARFAAFLQRSPETATADDIRRFQLHLAESGISICNRNRIMTGVKFLLKVTLRRHDLAAEIYHLKEPIKLPLIMSPGEAQRLVIMADKVQVKVMLALGYGCGLQADIQAELCLNLGDGVGQGQAAAFSWPSSTPSVNLTPVITFGN
jgi:integrase/recombinase XerD